MKILFALAAAGLLSTTVSAQSTTVTQKTTTVHKTSVMPAHPTTHRVCTTKWRHHKKIRTCRTSRY